MSASSWSQTHLAALFTGCPLWVLPELVMRYLTQQNALCNGPTKPVPRVFVSVLEFQNLNMLHKLAAMPTVLSWERHWWRPCETAVPKPSASSPVTWLPEPQRTSAQHF